MAEVPGTISNPNPEKNLIESDKLGFTTVAGGASGIVVVVALLTAVVDWLEGVSVNENVKIALIGLAGAGFLAWAIASGADVLARGYAASHVANKDTAHQPALQAATEKLEPKLGELVKAYGAAHPPVRPDGGTPVAALPAPVAPPAPVTLPVTLDVQVGTGQARAIAARVQADGKISYLVALQGQRPRWADEAEVTFR